MDYDSIDAAETAIRALQATGIQAQLAKVRPLYLVETFGAPGLALNRPVELQPKITSSLIIVEDIFLKFLYVK